MNLSIFVCLFFTLVNGLYEDQVGDSDWHQSYLGHISWMSFDNMSGGRRKVLLGSESGILAAVNAGSGKIAWRQELEKDRLFAITHYRSYLLTVSGNTNLILRSWDIETGLLKWEVSTDIPIPPQIQNKCLSQSRTSDVLLELAGSKKDQLILVSNDVMGVYSTRSGKEQWNITFPSTGTPLLSVDGSVIKVWLLGDRQLSYFEYDISKSQAPPTSSFVLSNEEISPGTECVLFLNRADNVLSPLCSFRNGMYTISTNNDKFEPVQIENEAESVHLSPGPPGYIHIGSNVYHSVDNTLKHVCSNCQIGEGSSDKGDTIRLFVQVDGDTLIIQNVINDERQIVSDPHHRGGIARVKVVAFQKSDGSLTWRVIVLREDASVSLLSQAGSVVWSREDGLGTIIASEMVDLPSAQFEAEGFFTLLDTNANPLIQAITRWRLQASLVQDVIKDIVERGVASLLHPLSSEELLRDKFNMRKVIVAVTAHNKVYGLDSSTGKIVWQLYLPMVQQLPTSDYHMYTLRTTSHPPHPPQMVVIGNGNAQCNGSVIFLFNPINGELINKETNCLSRNIRQSLLLPILDHTHSRILVYLDDNDYVGCFPSGCQDISLTDLNIFMYTANVNTGTLKGYRITNENSIADNVWQMVVPSNEKIIRTVNKLHNDHAHSMGRVRANRDVQYKYLNPNTIGIVTKSLDQPNKSSLSVYLIDSVNGGVIYRTSHRLASDPAGLILCENWILYHYFSIKSQRNEMTVTELYDPRNSTESVWSSLAPPTSPVITSQGYIFPTSIATISTTITNKGITPKSLLLGLPSGHILSLRKDILDPRREVFASQQMMEEGVSPYVPDIPLVPQAYINYNQTIARIRGIQAAATGLESTSLIFAYGLDLYVTRVQPSGQFDLLAEDFDYLLIAGVVLALILATFVLSWLSSRKTLNSLWK